MSEPLLDAADIQGDILPGFRRQFQLFVGLRSCQSNPPKSAIPTALPPCSTV